MPQLKETIVDTVIVGVYDSTMLVSKGSGRTDQLIIIQDKKTDKESGFVEDYPMIGLLVVPLVISLAGIIISHVVNKRKFEREIETLKTQANKNKAETEKIRKSFQPVVVGTIQAVNDKLVDTKINALKKLTEHKSEFTKVEQQYFEGDPVFDYQKFLDQVFMRFNYAHFEKLKQFKNEFSYFFAEKTFNKFTKLFNRMSALYETSESFASVNDGSIEHGAEDDVDEIIKLYDEVFKSLRSELHLDNTFIDDFIKSNQQINNSEE